VLDVRFYRDPEGTPHIWQHGVTEAEVIQALTRQAENRPGRDESRIIIGRTAAGRVLKIVGVIDDDGGGLFVVTALELEGKPLLAFRRRERKRGR
jgi:hypothetical protein